jgi:DDE superfamily endonuclease
VAAPLSVHPSGLPAYPDPAAALAGLQGFRAGLHACCTRRADALVDLTDALLSAQGPVASLPQLSLEPAHRRGWGSTYAALARGRIDAERLRELLADYPLEGGQPVYAVDVTTWPRCDAECSPQRGYYYHPSRHSAGQPIVARLHPLDDTDQTAARQIHALLGRLPAGGPVPWFVFDAGYDSAQLSLDLADARVVVLVRLRADRCFYADPPPRPPGAGGRPRRHGAKLAFADPASWPAPTASHLTSDQQYGT